jgi:biopolymer transport protein ExbD
MLKRHELPVIPTANLVDIAILLIIFYMACSNFVSQSSLKLVLPRAPDLPRQKEPLVLVTIDGKGAIALQGRPVASAADIEAGVSILVKDKATEDGRTVMFKCDESVSRDVFEPVLDAIVQGGGIVMAAGESAPGQ